MTFPRFLRNVVWGMHTLSIGNGNPITSVEWTDKKQHSGVISLIAICRKDWKESSWYEEGIICFCNRKRWASVAAEWWAGPSWRQREGGQQWLRVLKSLTPGPSHSGPGCSLSWDVLPVSDNSLIFLGNWRACCFWSFLHFLTQPSLTLPLPGLHRLICQFYFLVFLAYLSLRLDPAPLRILAQWCSDSV